MGSPSDLTDSRQQLNADGRLDSWKEIAGYLKRGARTVQRWERQDGLPVHRLAHQKQGSVYAYRAELDAWWSARGAKLEKEEKAAVPAAAWKLQWILLAAGVLVAVFLVGIWRFRGIGETGNSTLRLVPLTSYPGLENFPSLSPDGRQVAFTWDGGGADSPNIYVKLIGTDRPLRLTTSKSTDYQPVWAPDASSIAFLRSSGQYTSSIIVVPALGGSERKVAEVFDARSELPDPFLTWASDGKQLIAVDKPSPTEPFRLTFISAESGEKRRLTSPLAQSIGDTAPAVSPDGRAVAFVRCEFEVCDLFVQSLSAGSLPRRLTFHKGVISNPMWINGGQEILYLRADSETPALWRVSASGSPKPRAVSSVGSPGYRWTASRRGDRLAYVLGAADLDLYRLELAGAAGKVGEAKRIASSTRIEMEPDISPDGKRIAFMSSRSNSPEIWTADADGSNPVQLTSFGGFMTSAPKWSPDGKQIAFESAPKGNTDVFVISAEGGRPRALVAEPSNDCGPNWSRDGKWLYFASDRSGRFEIWKIPAAGGGPEQITRNGGYAAAESVDGRFLFFTKTYGAGETGIWRMPLGGGQETRLIESLSRPRNFAVTRDGIYFVQPRAGQGGFPLSFYGFATGQVKNVAMISQGVRSGFSVWPVDSASGRQPLWAIFPAVGQASGDLMLVENFR